MSDARRIAVRVLMVVMLLVIAAPAEAGPRAHGRARSVSVKGGKKHAAVHHAKKHRHGRSKSVSVRGAKKVARAKAKRRHH